MRQLRFRVLAALSAAGLVVSGCGKEDGGSASKPTPIKRDLVTVAIAKTPTQIVLTGMIAAKQRADLTADTQGKVTKVRVERGQPVKWGDPLLEIDVGTAALGQRAARADLEAMRAQRELAEQECQRTKQLFEQNAITKSEYDRQMTQCTAAVQQVTAAQARSDMLAKSVADGILRAPFDGVVAQKLVEPGEWVAPGRPLFTLVDVSELRVDLSVPEMAVSYVKPGQKVDVVAVADPSKKYTATITNIGGEIGRTRSLVVEATLDAPTPGQAGGVGLLPGMFAEAHVTVDYREQPVIPTQAITKRGKTWRAFVVKNGELEERVVQVGPMPEPGKVAIVQNLEVGEKIVASVCEKQCPCGYTFPPRDPPPGCHADPQLVDGFPVVE